MKDVLYVQFLKKNLLSISALDKKGYRVSFIDGEVLMWAKGETLNEAIVIGSEENGLYKLKGHPKTAMTHAIEKSCELWHRRLAHINYKVLPYIGKVVTNLPELKVDRAGICNGCAQGKNIKNPFPKRDSKAEGALELIHSDVCGPMPSSSISGYVYYVSFIDDYSRKTWIYFLKSKDEVFSKFKDFKALIENLSERKIKILRSDNGGEYTSKEFVSFCGDVRIKRELTTPYNPQQNGVAERKNRKIMEAVKTMIHDQDLPMCLWAEATIAAVYVQNRLSHSALGFKTPEEMFTGKKPEVSHLKTFGCPVFIHIPKEKRNKLEPSGKKGIFVGYCDYGLSYDGDHDFTLSGYTDADWAGSVADRKSTFGCCFSLGSAMILWQSRKQSSIALSTAEAEYIAACSASCKAIWLRKLLTGLFDLEMRATAILCDNQSCIKMTENPVFHNKSKHIEIRYHFIRDMVQRGALKLQYISTDEQVVDVLTKPLSRVKFEHFQDKLGIVRKDPP
jgi:transposase InsO family protein